MNRFVYLKNVVTLELNREKCVGCGMCLTVCPQDVFVMKGKRVEISHRDACMECGACAQNCPAEALTVVAGVGCAAAVINSMLGRTDSSCCCVIESDQTSAAQHAGCSGSKQSTCC